MTLSLGTSCVDALEDQRRRFVQALCDGRVVVEPGDASAVPADVVRDLQARPGGRLLGDLDGLARRLSPGGILILAEAVEGEPGLEQLRAALGQRYAFVETVEQRVLEGSVLCAPGVAAGRIVPLAEPMRRWPSVLVHLASDRRLPALGPSFLEADGAAAGSLIQSLRAAPDPSPMQPGRDSAARARAVALVERLVALNGRAFEQDSEIARLRRLLDGMETPSQRPAALPVRHAWPLAEDRATPRVFYACRPDDEVLLEGDAGARFLARYGLLGPAPDFAGGVAALNAATAAILSEAPDVSVVIPVYGQLGYTLNCLDSLLTLPDRARIEVIVVDDASPDASGAQLGRVRRITLLRRRRNQGFIASCNAGAARARGRLVVFLNNDTRVVAGWLDAFVDHFARCPAAGLVGSKMLYPDGALQEAGGIIWRDGSCWNYGRNDDPNRPEYCHARQVDYVSGCSVALPTSLFRDGLGGFDDHYAPAYCEDADLAMRVRQAGREVWFQPRSRVVHYEGRTGGTDTSKGVKSYQVRNSARLFLRWRDRLVRHRANGEAPHRERERQVVRRALVVDATTPTPRQDAGSVTTTLTLQLLQSLGYKACFVPQDNFLFQPGHTGELQELGVEVAYAPYHTDFEAYLRAHGRDFDVVLVYRVTVLEKTIDALRRFAPQAPILFHTMDLHFLRMQRQAAMDDDAAGMAEALAMKRRELSLIRRVDCTITHSTFERDLLQAEAPAAPVSVFPFMFAHHGTDMGFEARRDFCFLGGYNHAPNEDAVRFFAREILPLIHRTEPAARFIIAGANPTPEVLALAGPHVVVTGQVDDLREVFDRARVFACSLRIGAGTKGKVSTAMSYGMPVVSTGCGAEGMGLVEGEEVLLAETAEAFAAACLRVYRDEALWVRLSVGGQALVKARHSLEMGREVLKEAIETGFKQKLKEAVFL